jgi:hypothetical protein
MLVEDPLGGPELEPGLSALPVPKGVEEGKVIPRCTDAELDGAELLLALPPVADARLVLSVTGAVLEVPCVPFPALEEVDLDALLEEGVDGTSGEAVDVGGGGTGCRPGSASVTLFPHAPDPKGARIVAHEKTLGGKVDGVGKSEGITVETTQTESETITSSEPSLYLT